MKKLLSLILILAALLALTVPASAAPSKEAVLDSLRKPLDEGTIDHTFAVVGRLVIVTLWFDGGATVSELAKTDEAAKTSWTSAVESMQAMQGSMQTVLDTNDMSDYVAVLMLVDETDPDRILCAVLDGELAVDVAAGIDLIRGA